MNIPAVSFIQYKKYCDNRKKDSVVNVAVLRLRSQWYLYSFFFMDPERRSRSRDRWDAGIARAWPTRLVCWLLFCWLCCYAVISLHGGRERSTTRPQMEIMFFCIFFLFCYIPFCKLSRFLTCRYDTQYFFCLNFTVTVPSAKQPKRTSLTKQLRSSFILA